ncbi:hypothetical protein PRIPAC_85572 [Pristionchus pacificus]|nr:hypothetical protein PRIPAC_85572 [Pristionchus pacificus]
MPSNGRMGLHLLSSSMMKQNIMCFRQDRPQQISHDGLIGSTRFKRHTDMMIPGGFMGSEGEFEFSPSDQYLVYSSSADNSTKKVIMTTYSRTENYDVQYSMDYRQNGEEKLSVPSIFIFSVEEKMTLTMDVQIASSDRYYILGYSWVVLHGQELVIVAWANRWRNRTTITLRSFNSASCWMLSPLEFLHLRDNTNAKRG